MLHTAPFYVFNFRLTSSVLPCPHRFPFLLQRPNSLTQTWLYGMLNPFNEDLNACVMPTTCQQGETRRACLHTNGQSEAQHSKQRGWRNEQDDVRQEETVKCKTSWFMQKIWIMRFGEKWGHTKQTLWKLFGLPSPSKLLIIVILCRCDLAETWQTTSWMLTNRSLPVRCQGTTSLFHLTAPSTSCLTTARFQLCALADVTEKKKFWRARQEDLMFH